VLATARILPVVAGAQTVLALVLATVGIHAGRLLHDAVPSAIRAGVSAGAGTFSWMLFLPFSLVFGALARDRGLAWAAWALAGVAAVLAILLAVSVRTARAVPVEVDETARPGPTGPAPADLACRELVGIVSDYVDGVLPADWRVRADEHLQGCDGCTAYLQQIRDTVDLLARLDLPARPDGR
jgi:Putative zinc-finger